MKSVFERKPFLKIKLVSFLTEIEKVTDAEKNESCTFYIYMIQLNIEK